MAPLFLRLISWKTCPQSIQIFVKLDFFTNFLVVSFVLIYSVTLKSWAESVVSPAEKKCYFGFHNVNFKLSGVEFFMMSISKIVVPLYSPDFLLDVVKFARVLVTYVKHLQKHHLFISITFLPLRNLWWFGIFLGRLAPSSKLLYLPYRFGGLIPSWPKDETETLWLGWRGANGLIRNWKKS